MAAPTRRERLRADTIRDITAAALAQLREVGPAQLSLRAVAAALGMSPAGLYRYYDSRDALLTALIAESFHALADAVDRARDAAPDADVADRLLAAALAYRRWAVAHPQEFGLIYGTPVPGYAAPEDGPTDVATRRIGAALAPPLVEAWRLGRLRIPAGPPPAGDALTTYAEFLHPDLPPDAAAVVLGGWGRIHGFSVLEAFGHLRWLGPDTASLAEVEFRALVANLVAPAPPGPNPSSGRVTAPRGRVG